MVPITYTAIRLSDFKDQEAPSFEDKQIIYIRPGAPPDPLPIGLSQNQRRTLAKKNLSSYVADIRPLAGSVNLNDHVLQNYFFPPKDETIPD